MQATLIENNGTGRIAYDSLILDNPKAFSALNSKLAFRIVKSLGESPSSAIDLSRKLKIHEQKVYYHVRRLERAGIIYIISNEKRHGMTAKIFSVVSPVIAAKLYDKGVEVEENFGFNISPELKILFSPFISDGKFNTKIIIGNANPHGKYEDGFRGGAFMTDFLLFLGRLINQVDFPTFVLDTESKEPDLKGNLILMGSAKDNMIIERFNSTLPVYFEPQQGFSIFSTFTKTRYTNSSTGFILKTANPLDNHSSLLIMGGIQNKGLRAAVIAMTQRTNEIVKKVKEDTSVTIVEGIDKDGDGVIDSVKFLE